MFKIRYSKSIIFSLLLTTLAGDAFCNSLTEFSVNGQWQRTNALLGMIVGKDTVPVEQPILKTFSSDGCSLSPNSFFKAQFVDCCVQHDVAYWLGGTSQQKEKADSDFKMCMQSKLGKNYGSSIQEAVAETYYLGVSIGGVNYMPNAFRWGYGWNIIRDNVPLTNAEIAQAENIYGKNLHKLKEQIESGEIKYGLQVYTFDNSIYTFLPSDKIVYSYLQKVLDRRDIVTYGSQTILDSKTQLYKIKLKSCGEQVIEFKLNLDNIVFLLKNSIALSSNFSYIQKSISSINDPQGCLKAK